MACDGGARDRGHVGECVGELPVDHAADEVVEALALDHGNDLAVVSDPVAPKSVTVKGYWRAKPRRKAKPRAAAYAVTRAGRVVSRHTTLTGAINARKRLDRASFRRGEGRPYNVEKAS